MANPSKKVQTKKFQITLTERMIEMIEQLQEVQGLPSMSAVIHGAISEVHGKRFPAYTRPSAMTPLERTRLKEDEREEAESQAIEDKKAIVEELGGRIVKKKGVLIAEYFTYNFKKRFLQEYRLDMITPDLLNNQYFPNKEKVLQLQAEGKVDYEVE